MKFQRLYASLEHVKINPNVKIVVSGGKCPGESITEAEDIERFSIKYGVAKRQIIKEEKSTSTLENLKFTTEILEALEQKENVEVTIVTNNFHMFRAKFLAVINSFIFDR